MNITGFKSKLARLEAAVLVGLVVSIVATFFGIDAEQRAIADSLVRLHIKAASNSSKDQELKLAVRDRIISEVFADYEPKTREQALSFFEFSINRIETIAKDEILANGYDYSVRAEIVDEEFPEKSYGIMSLPAGGYTALRITIGSGEGQNWWCVMFPPVCLQSSISFHASAGLSESQWKTVTKKPVIKFKILEFYSAIKKWFK